MILEAVLIAISAYTFKHELVKPDKIFNWYDKLISKLPKWVYYPAGGCDKCLGGQLALWYGVFMTDFGVIDMIWFISLVIFIVIVINRLLPQVCEK